MEFGRRERTVLAESLIIIFVAYALLNMQFHFFRMDGWGTDRSMFLYYTNWSNILAAAG